MTEKRIKVPFELQWAATLKGWSGKLASLEGVVKQSLSDGLTKWKFVRAKGGWQYLGSIADSSFKHNGYSVMPDATEEQLSRNAKEIESSAAKAQMNHMAAGIQEIQAQVANAYNYTMPYYDNRILKIGETRWDNPDTLKADLEKRYRRKTNGGPYRYIAHKLSNRKSEDAAKAYLEKCGVKPINGEEYFPSHEALKYLRIYGGWCLGEWAMEGGFLPPIQNSEQGELKIYVFQ